MYGMDVVRKYTVENHWFERIVMIVIVISVVVMPISTLPGLSPLAAQILQHIDIVFIALFSLEYVMRVILMRERMKYIFSFYGIVDIMSIISSYLTLGEVDWLIFRIIRMLRVFRILKLGRYNDAIDRFRHAFLRCRHEMGMFVFATGIMLYISSFMIYYFENQSQPEVFKSVFHAMWWAVATLTTVGYGDIYPITTGGKLFTSVVVICGLGIVAAPAAILSAALAKSDGGEKS